MNDPLKQKNSRYAALFCVTMILIIVSAVRVVAIVRADNIAKDGTTYLTMAKEIHHAPLGEICNNYDYHPGYPIVVATVAKLVNPASIEGWILTAQCISLVMSLGTLLGIYYIASKLFNRRVAMLSILILGFSMEFIKISSDVLSDSMSVCMAVLSVALALATRRAITIGALPYHLALGAGLAIGAAYLTRPEGMGIVIVVVGLVLTRPTNNKSPIPCAISLILIFAGIALLAGPYMMAIGGVSQKKTIGDFISLSTIASPGSSSLAMASASDEFIFALKKTIDRLRAAIGIPAFIIICITWVASILKLFTKSHLTRDMQNIPGKLAMFVTHAALLIIGPVVLALEYNLGPRYISSRHMLIPAILLAPLMGAGICIAVDATLFLVKKTALPVKPKLTSALWILSITAIMIASSLDIPHEGKYASRSAGLILRKNDPGRYFLSPDPWLPFYAACPSERFQRNHSAAFILNADDISSDKSIMQKVNRSPMPIKYVVLTSRLLAKNNNKTILAQMRNSEYFTDIHSDERDKKYKLWLFTVNNFDDQQ